MRTQQTYSGINVFGVAALIADAMSAWHGPQRTNVPGPSRPAETAPRDGWLDRLNRWLWTRRQRGVEARLARSSDVFELEARMRELERGIPSRYY